MPGIADCKIFCIRPTTTQDCLLTLEKCSKAGFTLQHDIVVSGDAKLLVIVKEDKEDDKGN